MTSRNPMPPGNKAQIHKMLRELVALDLNSAEVAHRLQLLWPEVDQFQVNGLAIALGLESVRFDDAQTNPAPLQLGGRRMNKHKFTCVTESEKSALRVLRRAGAVDSLSAKPPGELTGATVTALRGLGRHGLADWRSRNGQLLFWITSAGLAHLIVREAA